MLAALETVAPVVASGRSVVVASVGGRLEPQLERAGGTLARLHAARPPIFGRDRNIDALVSVCRENSLNLLHSHGLDNAVLGAAVSAATGLPLVASCNELPAKPAFGTNAHIRALSKTHRIVAASGYLAGEIARLVPRLAGRIRVVPHGINIEAFDEAAVTTARTISLAGAWGVIEDPRPIILVPARLGDDRWIGRICEVVEATVRQRANGFDAQFVLVGEDGGTGRAARLEGKFLASGLSPHVRLVGHCADPEAALKLASIVLELFGEPCGVCFAALQAQAMGRPVVLGNSGAAPEAIEDGTTGWLVEQENVTQIAQKILAALDLDESARAHLALAARARIVSKNSTKTMNRGIVSLYEECWQKVGAA